jgi:hypothetical protein
MPPRPGRTAPEAIEIGPQLPSPETRQDFNHIFSDLEPLCDGEVYNTLEKAFVCPDSPYCLITLLESRSAGTHATPQDQWASTYNAITLHMPYADRILTYGPNVPDMQAGDKQLLLEYLDGACRYYCEGDGEDRQEAAWLRAVGTEMRWLTSLHTDENFTLNPLAGMSIPDLILKAPDAERMRTEVTDGTFTFGNGTQIIILRNDHNPKALETRKPEEASRILVVSAPGQPTYAYKETIDCDELISVTKHTSRGERTRTYKADQTRMQAMTQLAADAFASGLAPAPAA